MISERHIHFTPDTRAQGWEPPCAGGRPPLPRAHARRSQQSLWTSEWISEWESTALLSPSQRGVSYRRGGTPATRSLNSPCDAHGSCLYTEKRGSPRMRQSPSSLHSAPDKRWEDSSLESDQPKNSDPGALQVAQQAHPTRFNECKSPVTEVSLLNHRQSTFPRHSSNMTESKTNKKIQSRVDERRDLERRREC